MRSQARLVASVAVYLLGTACSALAHTRSEPPPPPPPTASVRPEPFAFGDFTWLNGGNRQATALLDSKYVTGGVLLDVNYCYSLHNPIDHTIVGSTVTGRHNELNLLMASIGGDFHWKGVRATLSLQYGARTSLVQRNDSSSLRGQYDLTEGLKYLREVSAGYHVNVLYGLNIDLGIFMSYVGLFSYLNFENWAYQPSFTSDNTPWYFTGLRAQFFPTERLKLELWVVNGWQSYSKYSDYPGVGIQLNYRPREWLYLVTSTYVGADSRGDGQRVRFHNDNSLQLRYWNRPAARGLSRSAFSITADFGFEHGGLVTAREQNFLSAMAYHRLWFYRNRLGWTVGGGIMSNPGRYLVLLPPGPVPLDTSPGSVFFAWDVSTTIDYLPDDFITYRAEFVHRAANVPYFSGPGGVTSPDGYIDTPLPAGWQPDRVQAEDRFIFAVLVRL